MNYSKLAVALVAAGLASGAYATNGMNVEGYGPIATGMGGASFAYDNGAAAMMNNPATLGLGADGSRLDLAVGFLGPDVTSTCMGGPCAGATATSGGDAYFMPAVGWVKKNGNLSYGVGMFAQGGMGTEYAGNTFMGATTGLPNRSELGVGRLIAPVSFNVSPDLVVGGSLDFVWAMLDIKMLATDTQVNQMTGGMDITVFNGGNPTLAYLNFSDGSDFTGKAKGTGWAGKLGFTYKLSQNVSLGGTYHSKTSLSDMETGASGASFGLYNMANGAHLMTDQGKITVVDFQWPETYGLGIAVQATPTIMVAADVKRIGWADVMKSFRMTYSSAGFGTVNMTMPQNWDDQTVLSLGLAYKATNALTLRAGANLADNPIPDMFMNPLFPAIVKNHYTVGFGYAFTPASDLNFSLQYAPEVSQTGTASGVKVDHSQVSWQLMYSSRF